MRAYIGLGSNLDNPQQQVESAMTEIAKLDQTQLISRSSLYQSVPMGPQDQPDYINAVVAVETTLSPHALLDALQQIEQSHGRIRKRHWGERTLDLDILLYADKIMQDERLTLPHPGVAERAFVVYPLAEIAPALDIPGKGSLTVIQQHCPFEGLNKL